MTLSGYRLYIAAMLVLTGCASMKPSEFARGRPIFEPTKFFAGRTTSSGVMETRGGAPTRRVTTETVGHWKDNALHVKQEIVLGNAKAHHRSWVIRRVDNHRYEATANDIVGTARAEAYGNVFHWSFTLKLSPGNPLGNVRMSQWMYLQPDGKTMINHSTIRKFGVVVGQVTEQFRREDPPL